MATAEYTRVGGFPDAYPYQIICVISLHRNFVWGLPVCYYQYEPYVRWQKGNNWPLVAFGQ